VADEIDKDVKIFEYEYQMYYEMSKLLKSDLFKQPYLWDKLNDDLKKIIDKEIL